MFDVSLERGAPPHPERRMDLVQGTLDVMILKALQAGPAMAMR